MTTAEELINACETKNRTKFATLIAAIPNEKWQIIAGRSTSRLTPATIQADHSSGGTGINTYETVYVSVLLDDQDIPIFADTFTAEELQIPNYIPKDERPI